MDGGNAWPMERSSEIWDREIAFARNLKVWQAKAHELHLVAELICDSYDETRPVWIHSVVRMLRAFVLENYAKGLILHKYPDKFIKDRRLKFESNGHNLVFLLRKAGLRMTDEQEGVLALYSVSGEWRGRYPLPLSAQKVLPERPSFSNQRRRLEKTRDGDFQVTSHDTLHGGITRQEDEVYFEYLRRLRRAYNRRLNTKSGGGADGR